MRTEPHEFEIMVVWFPINQNEIGPDVAIAVIAPLARERVIEVASRQQHIRSQHVDGFHQNGINLFAMPYGFLAFVVALDAVGVLNLPHSGSREVFRESRQQRGRRGARLSWPQSSRHWEAAARMAV